jgi:hypothetical protein
MSRNVEVTAVVPNPMLGEGREVRRPGIHRNVAPSARHRWSMSCIAVT